MLEELRIRGLGVIDDAVLELGPGFTALTGETGAGKTMVLTGLALLLGGRSDSGLVRAGADRTEVEGRIRVDPTGSVAGRALEAGGGRGGAAPRGRRARRGRAAGRADHLGRRTLARLSRRTRRAGRSARRAHRRPDRRPWPG